MKFFLFHSPLQNPNDKKNEEVLVAINELPHNTNEGSEFLDDGIRMKEQPLENPEERIATGYPQGLL